MLCNKLPQNFAAENNKHLLSYSLIGQESRQGLAGCLWLRVSHKAAIKV